MNYTSIFHRGQRPEGVSPARVKGLSALYIHQIVLRDVRGFNMNIPLWNEWTQQPLDSTLLTGPNGSVKTTVLRVVAALWESFGEWLRLGKTITPAAQRDTLKGAGQIGRASCRERV